MSTAAVVYRWYVANDRLLYVGMSSRLPDRTKAHKREADWWVHAVRCEAIVYATRAEAAEAERLAIAVENPRYNQVRPGRPRPKPRATIQMNVQKRTGVCDVCEEPLEPLIPGQRGRPPLRHPQCQVKHRREYLARKQREHRARGTP